MMSHSKMLFVIVLLGFLSAVASAQQAQGGDQELIQFQSGAVEAPTIKIIQAQYFYNPELNNQYDIVHKVIYPKNEEKNKFVASVPKDNFVKKLNEKNKPITLEVKEGQVQQKVDDILKKQSIEQEKPLLSQKQNVGQKLQPEPQPQAEKQAPSVNQQVAQAKEPQHEQDLFLLNADKNAPNIQKTDKNIKFKEHEFTNPVPITNYPFETQGKKVILQKEKQKEISGKVEEKVVDIFKETQQQTNKQSKPHEKKEIVKTEDKVNQKVKVKQKDNKQQKQNLKKQQTKKKQQTTKTPADIDKPEVPKPAKPSQQIDIDNQYYRLIKSLQVDQQQLQSHLAYSNNVKDLVEESSFKFLIVKIIIWIVIAISIYQATCGAHAKQELVEKSKYAPVNTADSIHAFQVIEREEQKN